MNFYLINSSTLAILPYGKRSSIIYEKNGEKIINKSPINIIKANCLLNGSSYMGRYDATVAITGLSYKAPIQINNDIICFPTTSPRLKSCCWIILNNIRDYYYDDKINCCIVDFFNNKMLNFNMSYNVLDNQVCRAAKLDVFLRQKEA